MKILIQIRNRKGFIDKLTGEGAPCGKLLLIKKQYKTTIKNIISH
jgi:hypothetical protein